MGRWLPSSLGNLLASGQAGGEVTATAAVAALGAYAVGAAAAAAVGLRRADVT